MQVLATEGLLQAEQVVYPRWIDSTFRKTLRDEEEEPEDPGRSSLQRTFQTLPNRTGRHLCYEKIGQIEANYCHLAFWGTFGPKRSAKKTFFVRVSIPETLIQNPYHISGGCGLFHAGQTEGC